jgi:hypothetical protein
MLVNKTQATKRPAKMVPSADSMARVWRFGRRDLSQPQVAERQRRSAMEMSPGSDFAAIRLAFGLPPRRFVDQPRDFIGCELRRDRRRRFGSEDFRVPTMPLAQELRQQRQRINDSLSPGSNHMFRQRRPRDHRCSVQRRAMAVT